MIPIGGIYPILDQTWLEAIRPDEEALARLLGVCAPFQVQLRCKGSPLRCRAFTETWVSLLRRHASDTRILINDHPELVRLCRADGIHVGQNDRSVAECRRELGQEALIGLSTHTLDEVRWANGEAADYIGFGPVFGTTTKADALQPRGVALLARACVLSTWPVIAIGGIGVEELPAIVGSKAAGAAMISGLFPAGSPPRLTEAMACWSAGRGRPVRD
ncbi:MAG: thiamine phosphate synthase [Magnetococcales bacterium]|nr:thiamine phosphate synthase [Magnetococcales bacterium]